MSKRTHRALIAALLASMAGSVSAQIIKPVLPLGPSNTVGYNIKNGQALITGTAIDDNALPLPNASLRLRNLVSKQIEQVATANYLGEFAFLARPEVPYVVEITDRVGHILAVGDIITAQSGDVAGALISIPSRVPAVAGVFGDTAASVASAATGTGITVIEPQPPLSPEK
jgi:hypothetical protein